MAESTVAAVYDRRYFVDSRKNRPSQSAATVARFEFFSSLLRSRHQIRRQYPQVGVTVFNVDHAKPNADIFAVPTYTLDGRLAFPGNPTDQQIHELLNSVM